ncbi:MAG: PepSY domain-containing protein [Ectothiorhodospiraceae bacterium]|nr:PepSY domain-containing protein [Chromatiales bacterium]MCP5154464.1 PepSY domain-containing protein [Ectothiorhodospiraceae bacterium]
MTDQSTNHRKRVVRTRWPMAALGVALALHAGGVGADRGDHDHDVAREALARGELLPLAAVLATVASRFPGDVVKTELEREHGRWLYEIKLITLDGRLVEVEVDARTAAIVEVER